MTRRAALVCAVALAGCSATKDGADGSNDTPPVESDVPPAETDATPGPDTADTDPSWEDTDPFTAGDTDETDGGDDTDDTSTSPPTTEVDCFDGGDDDGDGLIDCEDGDCATVCFEAVCDDGVDDDLDGDLDCWDEDCWGAAPCEVVMDVGSGVLRRVLAWRGPFYGASSVGSSHLGVCPGPAPPSPLRRGGYSSYNSDVFVSSLDGSVQIAGAACGLHVDRIWMNLHTGDTGPHLRTPQTQGARVEPPCDALLARHGLFAGDLFRFFFAPHDQPLSSLRVVVHAGEVPLGTSSAIPSGSPWGIARYGRIGQTTASRYPVAFSGTSTSRVSYAAYCHRPYGDGVPTYQPWASGSVRAILNPTRFPVPAVAP